MAEFTDILDEHIQEGSLLTNFSSWMVKLTIDFISTTMFAQDFHTMSHAKNGDMTEGEVYLTQLPITIKVRAIFNLNLHLTHEQNSHLLI